MTQTTQTTQDLRTALEAPCITALDADNTRKGDWMQTFTGRRFWPLDPRGEDVIIEDIAHALSLLTRYGGHCTRFYSVAEHSVLLARAASPENALWLLLHDASEAYLSDMVRPLKRHMPEYRAAEDRVAWAVYEAFRLDPGVEPAEVKALDNRILMDERAQVMSPTGDTWNYGGARDPLGVTLQFWSPEQAECEFLALFSELTGLAVVMPALRAAPPRPVDAERVGTVRTALEQCKSELVTLHHGDCDMEHAEKHSAGLRMANAALRAAPPRPVDAGRVERASAVFYDSMVGPEREFFPHHTGWAGKDDAFKAKVRERMALALKAADAASPAHSPDKAVTQDGVDVRLTSANGKHWRLEGPGWTMQPIGQVSADEAKDLCERALAGLAPEPAGTEAGRGVIPAGWKIIEAADTPGSIGPGDIALTIQWPNGSETVEHVSIKAAQALGYAYPDEDAATTTPPVSPSPDSTGPAGNMPGDITRARLDLCVRMSEDAEFHEEREGFRLEAENIRRKLAAPTPSAPIADPSPDSTGQGDAQIQEGGR